MPKKLYTPEQIVGELRQIEVLISQGKTVLEAGIVKQTFYRWRKEYGGLQMEQARKLKDLHERERPTATSSSRSDGGETNPEGHRPGRLISPKRRRQAACHAGGQG
jgi:hypothetical protein